MFGKSNQSNSTLNPSATRLLIISTYSQGELSWANRCCSALQSGWQDSLETNEQGPELLSLIYSIIDVFQAL